MPRERTRIRSAIELAAGGMRPLAIAEALGLRPDTISAYLSRARAAGVAVPKFPCGKPSPAVATMTRAHRDRLVSLARDGHPPREVGELVGRTPQHVSQQLLRLRKAGMDVPRTRPGRRQPRWRKNTTGTLQEQAESFSLSGKSP